MAILNISSITKNGCWAQVTGLSVYPEWAQGDRTCDFYFSLYDYSWQEVFDLRTETDCGIDYELKHTETVSQTSSSCSVVVSSLESDTTYYCYAVFRGYDDDQYLTHLKASFTTDAEIDEDAEWFVHNYNAGTSLYDDYTHHVELTSYRLVRYSIGFSRSGTAKFYTTGSEIKTRGYLSTSDDDSFNVSTGIPNSYVKSHSGTVNNPNFSIEYDVKAGVTYYLWVRSTDGLQTGIIDVHIDAPVNPESPIIESVIASQIGTYKEKRARISWTGLRLKGCSYTVDVDGAVKASGFMQDNKNEVTLSFAELDVEYIVTVTVSNSGHDPFSMSVAVMFKTPDPRKKPDPWMGWHWGVREGYNTTYILCYIYADFIDLILEWFKYLGMDGIVAESDYGPFAHYYGTHSYFTTYEGLLYYAYVGYAAHDGDKRLYAEQFNIALYCISKINPNFIYDEHKVQKGDIVKAIYFHEMSNALDAMRDEY